MAMSSPTRLSDQSRLAAPTTEASSTRRAHLPSLVLASSRYISVRWDGAIEARVYAQLVVYNCVAPVSETL
jgi:hypothetical protein